MENKTIIGITMGCPASIGPELVIKFFQEFKTSHTLQPIVIGDRGVLEKYTAEHDYHQIITTWKPGSDIDPNLGIPVFEASQLDANMLTWGHPSPETGKAMAAYITTAVQLIEDDYIDGLTTCPIAKSSLQAAGYNYPGHTEMLAQLTGADNFGMLMAGKSLIVTLVTIHCPLKEVSTMLSVDTVLDTIKLTDFSLRNDFGIAQPKVSVAGLNPHASENGIFGNEEEKCIIPAIEKARQLGIDAIGPFPPDTIFNKCIAGNYDAVVCMYHDQGLIPFKLVHFSDGVNVTIGLPIVRTSVDHGTAYDIAGRGIADHRSLAEAVYLAATIVKNRQNPTRQRT